MCVRRENLEDFLVAALAVILAAALVLLTALIVAGVVEWHHAQLTARIALGGGPPHMQVPPAGQQPPWDTEGAASEVVGANERGREAAKEGLAKYLPAAAEYAELGFTLTAVILVLAFALVGFRSGGIYGAIAGAVLGIFVALGVWGMWYNLERGHVVPFAIGLAVGIAAMSGGVGRGWALEIAFATATVLTFSVWLDPYTTKTGLWQALNVFEWSGYTSWTQIAREVFGLEV